MRQPGFLTGAFDGLTDAQRRRKRVMGIMGLPFDPQFPKPPQPTFPMHDRAGAVYQLQRARMAKRTALITPERFASIEREARAWIDGSPMQTTVDGVRMSVDKPRMEPHEFEQRAKRKHDPER